MSRQIELINTMLLEKNESELRVITLIISNLDMVLSLFNLMRKISNEQK